MSKPSNFGSLIDKAIENAGLKKKNVADKANIHPTSLSRIIAGTFEAAEDTALELIAAINSLANREVLNKEEAMNEAGFSITKDFHTVTKGLNVNFAEGAFTDEEKREILHVLGTYVRGMRVSEDDSYKPLIKTVKGAKTFDEFLREKKEEKEKPPPKK